MWAQLIIMRVKPGKEGEIHRLYEMLQAAEQLGSGLVRSTGARDEKDPSRALQLRGVRERGKGRAREQDERRQEALVDVRAHMAEILDGPPEFVDLGVISDFVA